MRAVIIGNGNFDNIFEFNEYDYIICADGGYNHAKRYGITPDIIIGDMDSVKVDITDENTVIYPKEKDFTDGELAVHLAIEKGCEEIVLLGMTGSRLDHTIANICLLKSIYENGKKGYIADKNNKIYYINRYLELNGLNGKTVSLLPMGGDLEGISNSGFYYPLNNETICFGSTRGISNVITDDKANIKLTSGEGIVVITDGQ